MESTPNSTPRGAKRAAHDEPDPPLPLDGNTPITHNDLTALFAQHEQKLSQTIVAGVGKDTADLLTKYHETQVKPHLDHLGSEVSMVKQRIAALEKKSEERVNETNKQIEHNTRVNTALLLAQAPQVTNRDLDLEDFAREPDPAILRIGSQSTIAKDALLAVAQEWISDTIPDSSKWSLLGPASGTQFRIRFEGLPGYAAKNARKANLSLKKDDGSWTKLTCPTPAGPPSTLYIGKDENPRTQVQARHLKNIFNLLTDKLPGNAEVKSRRQDATIQIDKKDVAKVNATSYQDIKVEWKEDILLAHGLDKTKLNNELAAIREARNKNTDSGSPWTE